MLLNVRREAKRPLLFGTVILVFLSIFTKYQASSPFEAMNSAHVSMCQKDVRPSVQKRWRTRAFSSVSTGDSDILSSCDRTMSMHEASAAKFGLLSNQGISGSISLEA